ncbi:MAG: hypothetical protein II240_04465 [Bacteroidaceae bacterium]|nr:hypothetical protein [Bacteroidaceae bacterium]
MLREANGARRYNTLVTLTYSERVVDDYGHASYDEPMDMAEVYASVVRMSATKTMMTFQQADVVGLEIELREPNVAFNGLRYDGHDVHFSEPEPMERGRILRIQGWYQIDR